LLSGKQLSERRREREREGAGKVDGAFAQPARGTQVWQFKREQVAARKMTLTKGGKLDAGSLRRAKYAIQLRVNVIGENGTESGNSDGEDDDSDDDAGGSGTNGDDDSSASGSERSSNGDDCASEHGSSGSGSGGVVEGAKRKAIESRSDRAARRVAAAKSPKRKAPRNKK
jgi:hypothetical protein